MIRTAVSEYEVDSYLAAALWTGTDDEGNPLDDNFTVRDFADEARRSARSDLEAFWFEASFVIDVLTHDGQEVPEPSNWPHDFWLNRNGHGTGFWDKEERYGAAAEVLSVIAKRAGEVDVYVGDNGEVFFS